ncbi:FAD-dependent monooxygenase [Rhizobium leguminosarum]|uniref:FAD binding domain-containing protein n=1 Tax=Rhizobium leguminosarum TaxID=384 RepID=UPI003F9B84E8
MTKRAIVIGGSIAGLFAAAFLRKMDWEVDVYERVDVELHGRGAGIVTHPPLIECLELIGATTDDLGVHSEYRTALDAQGRQIASFRHPQLVTSWDRLHTITRSLTPDANYHVAHMLEHFAQRPDGRIEVSFTNGQLGVCDLLVGADGFRSTVRGHLFPEVQPSYAGYVVWRGLTAEADIGPDAHAAVFNDFGFFLPDADGEVIGYPIAGERNDISVGNRRYNFVWYRVVPPADLTDLLTDENGTTHDISIPPPLIRPGVLERFKADAREKLPPAFAEIVERTNSLFFTPIYDLAAPQMAHGRVALVGDAAVLARPHIGAGATKAAQDARALAEALQGNETIEAALVAYDQQRRGPNAVAYRRGQHMGEYLVPGQAGGGPNWAEHHNLQTIMHDTAVLNFY